MNVMKLFNVCGDYKTHGDLGVEIEVEGCDLPIDLKHWDVEYDGSLDDGKEYVLKAPYKLLGVRQAILELKRAIQKTGAEFDDSVRAGVHVHVNVQDLTKAQLFNLIVLWLLFEEVLLGRCGKYRKGNLFCLPLATSVNVVRALYAFAEDNGAVYKLNSENLRYCAVNVCSLHKYGSLEFRAMRTESDLEITYQWAKLLNNMKRVACTFENPTEIIESLDRRGGVRFLYNRIISEDSTFLGRQPKLAKKCEEGILTASAIAYASDWQDEEVEEESKPVEESIKPALDLGGFEKNPGFIVGA